MVCNRQHIDLITYRLKMFLDTIRLLVRNENWPKANLHVTKENKSFKKKICGKEREFEMKTMWFVTDNTLI